MTQPHLRKTTATLLASASLTLSSRIQAQEYNPTAPRLASWPQDLAHPQGTNGWFYRVGTPGTGTGVGTWTDVWAEAIYNNAAAYRYPGPTGANVLDPAAKYALTNQKTTIFHYNTGVDGSVTAADCANGVWASFHFRRTNQAPGAGTSMEFKMVAHYAATSTSVAQSVLVWNEPINNGDLNWRSRTFSLPNFRKDTSLEISVGSASALVDYTNYDLEIDVQRRPTLEVIIQKPMTRNTIVRPLAAGQEKLEWKATWPASQGWGSYAVTNRATGAIVSTYSGYVQTPGAVISNDLTNIAAGEYQLKVDTSSDSYVYPFHIVAAGTTTSAYTFNSDGVWLQNGAAFFPIGIYHAMLPASTINGWQGRTDYTTDRCLADVQAKGFNVVHISNETMTKKTDGSITPGGDWSYGRWADLAQNRGLKVIQWLFDDQYLKGNVDAMRNHPALMAWNYADEPLWGDYDKNLRIYNILRSQPEAESPTLYAPLSPVLASGADPRHPTFIGHWIASQGSVYAAQTDVISSSYYPIQQTNVAAQNYPSQLASLDGDHAQLLVGRKTPIQPFMPTIQAFGTDRAGFTFRIPTTTEYRNMVYQALVHGARGYMVYGYTDPDPNANLYDPAVSYGRQYWLAKPTDGTATGNLVAALWGAVGSVNKEVIGLGSFLTAPGGSNPTVVAPTATQNVVRVLQRNTSSNSAIFICVNLDSTNSRSFSLNVPSTATVKAYAWNTTALSWGSTGSNLRASGTTFPATLTANQVRLFSMSW